jgi:predicted house-cleaning noncanonical NTP pyrophosphatase (MazG superfamily)
LAAKNDIVVVLAGGVLSHAYHALRREGASVECVDLFGATEDREEYNKIVRDGIPGRIADRGEHYEVVRLEDEALVLALRRKLVEEALEALDAGTGTDLVAELADVSEVIRAISLAIDSNPQEVEVERQRKLKKIGGFDKGYMLRTTASPHSLYPVAPIPPLVPISGDAPPKTIRNPELLPQKPIYKRPDHRNVNGGTEELLTIEIELNRLGKLPESIDFGLPANVNPQSHASVIEFSRTGVELRAAIRVRSRALESEPIGQTAFDFPNPPESD